MQSDALFALLKQQLNQMEIPDADVSLLRSKDGVHVARVTTDDASYVMKYFEKPEYRREIDNYLLLDRLNIPTLRLIAHTGESLLLEDLNTSAEWRPATPADVDNPTLGEPLAAWYRTLHDNSRGWAAENSAGLYAETEALTAENLTFIARTTGTADAVIWNLLHNALPRLLAYLLSLPPVLTYNDFHYTNLAVSRDGQHALLFDYNLLGRGYPASDLKNVTYEMKEPVKAAFLNAYGPIDSQQTQFNEIVGPVCSVYIACRRPTFPTWAKEELSVILDGRLAKTLDEWLARLSA